MKRPKRIREVVSVIIAYGDGRWWLDDNEHAHRLLGPAKEYDSGNKVWCLHGNQLREQTGIRSSTTMPQGGTIGHAGPPKRWMRLAKHWRYKR